VAPFRGTSSTWCPSRREEISAIYSFHVRVLTALDPIELQGIVSGRQKTLRGFDKARPWRTSTGLRVASHDARFREKLERHPGGWELRAFADAAGKRPFGKVSFRVEAQP